MAEFKDRPVNLLKSKFAEDLYKQVKDLPIIDYHCHLSPKEIYEDKVFDNIGVETAKRFTEDGLREALGKLTDEEEYGSILRAKGIVQAEDGRWLHFDYVPGETEIRYGSADYTGRLCVIGTHIDESALHQLFGV